MSIERRVAKLEGATGTGRPCVLCERRAEAVERSPIMRHGFVETPGDSYELNCPGCGRPFTLQVVYVERREAA